MALDARQIETAFIVSSSVATLFSSSVLLTAILFPTMRKRLFMQIIVNISFCDTVASCFSALGFPPNHTFTCIAQSFAINFFYKASWFWTAALSYQLYTIFMDRKIGLSMLHLHVIIWPLSFLLTMLPMTTTPFGRDDDGPAEGWCFLDGKDAKAIMWVFVCVYIPLLFSILLMMYFSVRIYLKYRDVNMRRNFPEVHLIIDALRWYPIGLIVTWGPNLCVSLLSNFRIFVGEGFTILFNAVTILATQNGSLITIIFFVKSTEARYRWRQLFYSLCDSYCCFHVSDDKVDHTTPLITPISYSQRDVDSDKKLQESPQGHTHDSNDYGEVQYNTNYNPPSYDGYEYNPTTDTYQYIQQNEYISSYRHLWENVQFNPNPAVNNEIRGSSRGTSNAALSRRQSEYSGLNRPSDEADTGPWLRFPRNISHSGTAAEPDTPTTDMNEA